MTSPDAEPPAGGDLQRTRLAAERTLLSWLRSSLTALVVGLTVARVLPELAGEPRRPYLALGVAYCALGLALVGAGVVRYRSLTRDPGHTLGTGAVTALGAGVGVLGLATLVVLLVGAG